MAARQRNAKTDMKPRFTPREGADVSDSALYICEGPSKGPTVRRYALYDSLFAFDTATQPCIKKIEPDCAPFYSDVGGSPVGGGELLMQNSTLQTTIVSLTNTFNYGVLSLVLVRKARKRTFQTTRNRPNFH